MVARRPMGRLNGFLRQLPVGDIIDPAFLSANLAALAGLTGSNNKAAYFSAAGSMAVYDLTAYARTLLDDPDQAAMLNTLGLFAPVVCKAYRSTNQSITNAVFVEASFDTTVVEIGGTTIHVPGGANPERLTAPVAGAYLCGAAGQMAFNASNRRLVRVMKNGSIIVATDQRQAVTSSSGSTSVGVVSMVELAAGDYLTAQFYQDSGGALNVLGLAEYSPQLWMVRIG